MSEEPKDKSGQKAKAELRANLLKRKAQAKAKQPPRDRNEGRQS